MAPFLPYEYILLLWLSICPPMWWYIIDPRVDSMQDAKKGIHNPDQWNRTMPRSPADERRHKVALVYFAFVSCLFTYLMTIWTKFELKM